MFEVSERRGNQQTKWRKDPQRVYKDERPVFPSQASEELYPVLHISFRILDTI